MRKKEKCLDSEEIRFKAFFFNFYVAEGEKHGSVNEHFLFLYIYIKFQNKASIVSREKDLSKIESNVEKMRTEKQTAEQNYEAAKKHFQAVSAGLSANADGEAATLNDQLISEFLVLHF